MILPTASIWLADRLLQPIRLRDARVKFEFHRYKAKHAFANETANEKKLAMLEYNPQAAELAWKRTLDFLAKQLK